VTQLIDITKPRIRVFADERTAAMIKAAESAPLPPLPCSTPLLRARDDMVFMVTAAMIKAARRRYAKAFLPPLDSPARKPRQSPPDGLKTAAQAAAKFGCSIKTLNGHVAAGDLRYVIIGKGTKRPHKMFTDADLNDFIANQTRTGSPACRSIASRVRRSGTSNFESEVIAFTGQPRPRPGAKPKR